MPPYNVTCPRELTWFAKFHCNMPTFSDLKRGFDELDFVFPYSSISSFSRSLVISVWYVCGCACMYVHVHEYIPFGYIVIIDKYVSIIKLSYWTRLSPNHWYMFANIKYYVLDEQNMTVLIHVDFKYRGPVASYMQALHGPCLALKFLHYSNIPWTIRRRKSPANYTGLLKSFFRLASKETALLAVCNGNL